MPIYEGLTRGVVLSTSFASIGALMFVSPLDERVSDALVVQSADLRPTRNSSRSQGIDNGWWATALGL